MPENGDTLTINGDGSQIDFAIVATLRELLHRGDEAELVRFIRRDVPPATLARWLHSNDTVVAGMAARCLGLLGGPAAVWPLVSALQHDDSSVVTAAEESLWRVWLNESGVAARRGLHRAAEMIRDGRYDAALVVLDDVVARFPSFAEAYHQRAMVYSLSDRELDAVGEYKRAIRLNPWHFGAMAGMGHAHANLGHVYEALRCYRSALKIHPRMEGLRQSIRKIRSMGVRPSSLSS